MTQPTAEYHVPERGFTARFAGAVLAGSLALTATACTTGTENEAYTPHTLIDAPTVPVPKADIQTPAAATCEVPSTASVTAVTKLFKGVEHITFDGSKTEDPVDELWRNRIIASKKNGLHIIDPRRFTAKFEADADARTEKYSVKDYLNLLDEFTAQYGITVQSAQTHKEAHYGQLLRKISYDTMPKDVQDNVKYNIISFIKNLAELPVELVEQVRLKKVVLADIENPQIGGMADVIDGGLFYLDPLKPLEQQTFTHEFTHLWHGRHCSEPSAINEDTAYIALNPGGRKIYVGDRYGNPKAWLKPYQSNENLLNTKKYEDIVNELSLSEVLRDRIATADLKRLKSQYKAMKQTVVMKENYGFDNAGEDEATMGEEIFSPYMYPTSILDKDTPILRKKALFLFARMYDDDPRIVRYFEEVGNKD
jgi:hypothetical protein